MLLFTWHVSWVLGTFYRFSQERLRTIRVINVVINQALGQAFKMGLISLNPDNAANPPKSKTVVKHFSLDLCAIRLPIMELLKKFEIWGYP